ncbi:MAG: hypothetical protein ACE15C_14450 [Phycisphaerae bacterium]
MTSSRLSFEVAATAARFYLPGQPPYTLTNTGSEDVYYSTSPDMPAAALAGDAAGLQAVADGRIAAGKSVSFGANVRSVLLACATGKTSTVEPASGVAV